MQSVSGLNRDRQVNLQTSRNSILEQLSQTIQAKTGLPVQQNIPLSLWEMGLDPKRAMDTYHFQPIQTGLIAGGSGDVQNKEVEPASITQDRSGLFCSS